MEKFECDECHKKFKSLDEFLRCPYCKGHMDKIHSTAYKNEAEQQANSQNKKSTEE